MTQNDQEKQARIAQAAERALSEAQERSKTIDGVPSEKEYGGRSDGTEPVRYGDWEKKGIAYDF